MRAAASLRVLRSATIALLAAAGSAAPTAAATCNVPGPYPSLQAAVADAACATIVVAAGSYDGLVEIHRPLSVVGSADPAALLHGAILALDSPGTVAISNLLIQPYTETSSTHWCEGIQVVAGANVTTASVEVLADVSGAPCQSPIFVDDFEMGNLSRW